MIACIVLLYRMFVLSEMAGAPATSFSMLSSLYSPRNNPCTTLHGSSAEEPRSLHMNLHGSGAGSEPVDLDSVRSIPRGPLPLKTNPFL